MHWFSHILGLDDGSGPFYLFYSGSASFLLSLGVLGGLIGAWRKHVCHQRRCWRLSRHGYVIEGVDHALCRKHHPKVSSKPPTAEDIRRSLD